MLERDVRYKIIIGVTKQCKVWYIVQIVMLDNSRLIHYVTYQSSKVNGAAKIVN